MLNPDAMKDCLFCSLADTNAFLASVGSEFGDRWRNLGILWGYIVFNIAAALVLYWVARVPKGWHVGGLLKIFSPKVLEEAH